MSIIRPATWLWITVIYTATTFALSGMANTPRFLVTKYHLDWVLHAVEYGVLAVLLLSYLSASGRLTARFPAFLSTFLFCGVVGGLNEVLQKFVPHRVPSVADQIANMVGAGLFIALFYAFRYGLSRSATP